MVCIVHISTFPISFQHMGASENGVESTLLPFDIGNIMITIDKAWDVWLSNIFRHPCSRAARSRVISAVTGWGAAGPRLFPDLRRRVQWRIGLVFHLFFPWMNCNFGMYENMNVGEMSLGLVQKVQWGYRDGWCSVTGWSAEKMGQTFRPKY